MPDAPPTTPVDCPRCAYDLTGVVETWKDACPIEGTCSECGLEFGWADILRADRRRLPWLYEHASHWWSLTSLLITTWRVMLPWSFWRRVQLHHSPRLRRIVILHLWLAIPGALAWIAFVASLPSLVVWAWGPRVTPFKHYSFRFIEELLQPLCHFNRRGELSGVGTVVDSFLIGAMAFSLGFMLSILLASSSRRIARVQLRVVLRAGLYSLTPLALIATSHLLLLVASELDALHAIHLQTTTGARFGPRTAPIVYAVQPLIEDLRPLVITAALVWMIVYWLIALSRGMRLAGAWQIAVAGVIFAVLMFTCSFLTIQSIPYGL